MPLWNSVGSIFTRYTESPNVGKTVVDHIDISTQARPASPNTGTLMIPGLERTKKLLAEWPLFFVIAALFCLTVGIFPFTFGFGDLFYSPTTEAFNARATGWFLVAFLGWCISTGALGSIAYLAVNSLSIQKETTFDIGGQSLVYIRIVLGVLFAVVLSIPFGEQLVFFAVRAIEVTGKEQAPANNLFGLGVYLLMPFIFGFSTAVMLTVLGRFVAVIDAFFGGLTAGTSLEAAKAAADAAAKAAEEAAKAAAKAAKAAEEAAGKAVAEAAKATADATAKATVEAARAVVVG